MIIITLKRFFISFSIILIITAFLIFLGMNLQEGELIQVRIDTQNILFWGIIAFLLQIGIAITLLFNNQSIINNLKRVSRIGDYSHIQARKILGKMGPLGQEIELMMQEQNNLVVLRSNRISALNNLVRMLCIGYSEPILITDVNGDILSISTTFSEKIKKEGSEISWKKLSDLRPDIPLTEVLNHLEKQKLPWSDPEIGGVTCTPVFDKMNALNFCIWELETSHFNKIYKEKQAEKIKGKTRIRVQGFLEMFRNKKETL
ncbi:MAG: hypothetical protein JEY91_05195 [Spirochaetaceae bacterium]|nr:hypothetical protein [Spirochaetaceae bacterium]